MYEFILNDVENFADITLTADNFLSENPDLLHSIQNPGLLLVIEVAEDEVIATDALIA